jgi:hypothetical protein
MADICKKAESSEIEHNAIISAESKKMDNSDMYRASKERYRMRKMLQMDMKAGRFDATGAGSEKWKAMCAYAPPESMSERMTTEMWKIINELQQNSIGLKVGGKEACTESEMTSARATLSKLKTAYDTDDLMDLASRMSFSNLKGIAKKESEMVIKDLYTTRIHTSASTGGKNADFPLLTNSLKLRGLIS